MWCGAWWLGACATSDTADPVALHTPADAAAAPDAAHASSSACQSCHPEAYATWAATYHRTMTQRATPDTVLAPWHDTELVRHGRRYRLFVEDDQLYVDVPLPGTEGHAPHERAVRPVVMSTGSHHLQLYWMVVPWIEGQPRGNAEGQVLFEERCVGCHSLDEPARSDGTGDLRNGKVPRPELERLLSPSAPGVHGEALAQLAARERSELVDYTARLQHEDRLVQFPFGWFVREQRWIHEDDSFLAPPELDSRMEPIAEGWSRGCDRCHAVAATFDWSAEHQTGSAEAVDLGIACEACHGAGRAHAEHYRNPARRYARHLGLMAGEDDIVVPSELDPQRGAEVCAQCHAALDPIDPEAFPRDFSPGDDLSLVARPIEPLTPVPDWLQAHLDDDPEFLHSAYWNDGTMRIAGRDWSALRASGCYDGGLTCTTCHQLHGADPNDQLKPSATGHSAAGEGVCTDCHADHASEAHTHHAPKSSGARCMNCHMPHTTLGLLTAMRSHRVDSPSASRAADTGRPDACSLCHLDQPLSWTATHLTEWYGQPPLSAGHHSSSAASLDWLLRGDAAQRAVLAWHYGWPEAMEASGEGWTALYLIATLDDPYVAVRSIVRQRLRQLPAFQDIDWDPAASKDALEEVQDALLERHAEVWPRLHRPEVGVRHGSLDQDRVDFLRSLRDVRPVWVNE